MRYTVLHPAGFRATDVDLAHVDADATARIRLLLADHGFMVAGGQELDDASFVTFLAKFGPLAFSRGETPLAGFPDLNVVSNVGRAAPPRSVFHVDTSYVRRPPTYTALRAVEIPARGGETLFTNQYRALETLPPGLRRQLAHRTIRHVVTGLSLGDGDETEAEHPVVRRHPISGRSALYLSTPERCVAVSGMGDAQGQEMIRFLYAHSTAPGNVFRHAWSPGEIVMWDNRCVLHRADHSNVLGDRVLHRGMVAADAPLAGVGSGAL